MTLEAGPYTQGEVGDPLDYQFQDSNGDPIDLTGYTAKFVYKRTGNTAVTRTALLSTPSNGTATYVWQTADMNTAGVYRGEFFVSNLTNTYASEPIVWRVRSAVTVPTFP